MFRIAICTAGLLAACVMPQSRTAIDTPTANQQPGKPSLPTTSLSRSALSQRYFAQSKQQRELDAQIATKARELRQAKSDDERGEVTETLTELLGKDYDERLKGYDEELKRLEKTLADMRTKLQKRRAARDDMIKLRIKVLAAEAEDLGWPARHRRSSFPSLFRQGGTTSWPSSGSSPLSTGRRTAR